MYTTLISAVAIALFLNQPTLASCAHGTSLHRREEAEGKLKLPDFDYGTLRGPTNWHSIKPENAQCAAGKNQSPQLLDHTIVKEGTGFVSMNIETQREIPFENLGTTVEVVVNGTTTVANTTFALKQFHFHTPSEHRINDEYFPVEVHMVHEAEDDPTHIAVIALLLQLTPHHHLTTPVLDTVISHIQAIPKAGTTTHIPSLDFASLTSVINHSKFYHYSGSLTTPPCSEGVTFMIATNPLPLYVSTYNELKAIVKSNSRFVQGVLGGGNLLETAAKHL